MAAIPPKVASGKIMSLRSHEIRPDINADKYYAEINAAYYEKHALEPSQWQGRNMPDLKLNGKVEPADFALILHNVRPNGGPLTPRKESDRIPGHDFNWNAVKSATVMAFIAGDKRIIGAFVAARDLAIKKAESLAVARLRAGSNASSHEAVGTGNLVIASFMDTTSRPVGKALPDPHLHGHSIVMNATFVGDNEKRPFRALNTIPLLEAVPMLEAVYHTAFAHNVRELGYSLVWTGREWQITGVPDDVLDDLSKRTAVVGRKAHEAEIRSPTEKGKLGASTRQYKGKKIEWETLVTDWQRQVGKTRIETLRQVLVESHHGPLSKPEPIAAETAVERATQLLSERAWQWSWSAMVLETIYAGQGFVSKEQAEVEIDRTLKCAATGPTDLREAQRKLHRPSRRTFVTKAIQAALDYTTKESAEPGALVGQALKQRYFSRFSTRAVEENAAGCIALAKTGLGKHDILGNPIANDNGLSDEQNAVVAQALGSRDLVIALNAKAGPGKKHMLAEIMAGIEAANRTVHALAGTAEALEFLILDNFKDPKLVSDFLTDGAVKKPGARSVIIVDDAGVVGAAAMLELLQFAARTDCRIILAGEMEPGSHSWNTDSLRFFAQEAEMLVATISPIVAGTEPATPSNGAANTASTDPSTPLVKDSRTFVERSVIVSHRNPKNRMGAVAGKIAGLAHARSSFVAVAPTETEAATLTGVVRDKFFRSKPDGERWRWPAWKEKTINEGSESWRIIERGNLVELTRATKLGTAGARFQATLRDGVLVLMDESGRSVGQVPKMIDDAFRIFELRDLEVRVGDRLRVTRPVITERDFFKAQEVVEVVSCSKDGIRCKGGRTLPHDYQDLEYGWVCSPGLIPKDRVDHVVLLHAHDSEGSSGLQSVADLAKLSRKKTWIFTDNGGPFWSVAGHGKRVAPPPARTLADPFKPATPPAWFRKMYFQRNRFGGVNDLGQGSFVAYKIEQGQLRPEQEIALARQGPWDRADANPDLQPLFQEMARRKGGFVPAQNSAEKDRKTSLPAQPSKPATASPPPTPQPFATGSADAKKTDQEREGSILAVPAPTAHPVVPRSPSQTTAPDPAWFDDQFYYRMLGIVESPVSGRRLAELIKSGKIPRDAEVSFSPDKGWGTRVDRWPRLVPFLPVEILQRPLPNSVTPAPRPPVEPDKLGSPRVSQPDEGGPPPNIAKPMPRSIADASVPPSTLQDSGGTGDIPPTPAKDSYKSYKGTAKPLKQAVPNADQKAAPPEDNSDSKGDTFHVVVGSKEQGPFSPAELSADIISGKIVRGFKLRKNDGEELRVEKWPEFKDALALAEKTHRP